MIEVIKGWKNFILGLNKNAREKAKKCVTCKHKTKGKIEFIKDSTIKEIEGFICGKCKCPLSAKLRSDDKCPLGKF